MQAYLIDPIDQTIETVEYTGEWQTIYTYIDCDTFDVASTSDGLSIYVDDEGMMKADQAFFMIKGYPQPLAGRALVLGPPDEDGETTECPLNPSQIQARVTFVDLIKIHDRIIAIGK